MILFQWWQPFFGPLVGTLARLFKRAGITCITECHNVLPHERSPLDGPLIRFALSPSDHLITHSETDRQDLLAIFPRREITVSQLPSLPEFSGPATNSRSGRTILFFGKVRKYKGLDVLLNALPKVLSKVDCTLRVAGEFYDSIDKYEELILRNAIEKHVDVDNRYVANEEVAAIFECADVLVLPYISASQSDVARIALSNGLPVIASRVGGLSETVIDRVNGLLFEPGDPAALADQIVTYFRDELGPVFSENIRNNQREPLTGQLGEVIEDIMKRKLSADRAPNAL